MQASSPDSYGGADGTAREQSAAPVLDVPQHLVEKYDRVGPRYTSYPTAPAWKEDFDGDAWGIALKNADANADAPLGMYIHIPFCIHRCLFCACNVIIGKRQDIVEQYLERLQLEIQRTAERLPIGARFPGCIGAAARQPICRLSRLSG